MPTPVFISYKRDEAAPAAVLEPLEAALRAAGFEPWRDSQIGAGQDWHVRLDEWLLRCRGAVVIVSPQGVSAPWVRHEISVLMSRRVHDDRFPIVPLLVGGVRPGRLAEADLSPTRIGSLQTAVVAEVDDAAAAIAQVVAHLDATAARTSPFDRWVRLCADMLQRQLGERPVRDLLDDLGVVLPNGADPHEGLVCHLARDLPKAGKRLIALLRKANGTRTEEIEALYDALLPFAWIDEQSAAKVVGMVAGTSPARVAVLDAAEQTTPPALRARTLADHDEVSNTVQVDLRVQSDDPVREATDQLGRALRTLCCGDPDAPDKDYDPVLAEKGTVAVDAILDRPDAALLASLAAVTAPVSWYVLGGPAPSPDPAAAHRVIPPVDPAGEARAKALKNAIFPPSRKAG